MGELLESLRLGITPGIIVLIYLIIIKVIDTKKESNAVKINKEITECFRKLNSFLDYITKDILNDAEEKRDYAIKNSFKAFANSIIRHATSVIIANNIDNNKENIIENIRYTVDSNYYRLYNLMFLYKLCGYIKSEWKTEVNEDIVEIIYNNKFSKEEKLYNINNKINIKVDEYISIVMKQCHTYVR
jgi:hypothetical protein